MHFSQAITALALLATEAISHPTTPSAFEVNDLAVRAPLPSATAVHSFPLGYWAENLAVRATGEVLTGIVTPGAYLYQIDPTLPPASNAVLVHHFAGKASVSGIAEGLDDIFYVAAGNLSAVTDDGVVGSWSVYSVDFNGCTPHTPEKAVVEKVLDIPPAKLLNGLAFLDRDRGVLLATDSQTQAIYSIDVGARTFRTAINETETQNTGLAVNGIKVLRDKKSYKPEIFFTNSGKATLYKQPVREDGTPAGPAEEAYKGDAMAFEPDDFALNAGGDAYLTDALENRIVLHRAGSGTISNVTDVKGPTAVAFGRTRKDVQGKVLYISSTGGDGQFRMGKITEPAVIYKVGV